MTDLRLPAPQSPSFAFPRVGFGIAALVPGQGYVLLSRQGSHGAGTWSLPGGHLEYGETMIEAAEREAEEEIGVRLQDVELLPFITEDFFPEIGRHYITHYLHATVVGTPRNCEPEKAKEMIVARPRAFPRPLFCGIEQLIEAKLIRDAG